MGIPLIWNESPYMPEYISVDGVGYRLTKDWYEYSWETAEAGLLANTTSAPIVTNILADSDFVAVVGIASMVANNAGRAPVANQDITVLIVDSGSGRQLMDKPVSIRHVFGPAEEPFILTPPKLFVANSALTVTFINNANVDIRIRATLAGYKAYKLGVSPEKWAAMFGRRS